MSTPMNVELSGGNHESFKAALHAIEGIGGFALAWFFKKNSGYVSLTSFNQKDRVVALAKQYGFAVVIATVFKEMVVRYYACRLCYALIDQLEFAIS